MNSWTAILTATVRISTSRESWQKIRVVIEVTCDKSLKKLGHPQIDSRLSDYDWTFMTSWSSQGLLINNRHKPRWQRLLYSWLTIRLNWHLLHQYTWQTNPQYLHCRAYQAALAACTSVGIPVTALVWVSDFRRVHRQWAKCVHIVMYIEYRCSMYTSSCTMNNDNTKYMTTCT